MVPSSKWCKLNGIGKLFPIYTTLCFTSVFKFGLFLGQQSLANCCKSADSVMMEMFHHAKTYCPKMSWTCHDALRRYNSILTSRLRPELSQMMSRLPNHLSVMSGWYPGAGSLLELKNSLQPHPSWQFHDGSNQKLFFITNPS